MDSVVQTLSLNTQEGQRRGDLRLSFLGATGTVTGSKYLLASEHASLLVDCGLFQGYKQLRLRNWDKPPFSVSTLDAIVLTHAHIDHSGYLPVLVRRGFRGPVYATPATFELCRLLLTDSGHLQEEQARFDNRHGYSKHKPALPLYTEADALRSLELFRSIAVDEEFSPARGFVARFTRAGHMLGAASVHVTYAGTSILFSGDVGRANDPLMRAPDAPPSADFLIVESTYGDRIHPLEDPSVELSDVVNRAVARAGIVLMPSFAVGRAQLLMLLIARLKREQRIPTLPVFLDSPMAIDATDLYRRFASEHRLSPEECRAMCRAAQLVHSTDGSKALDLRREPAIIISASGMATGGRVVHHLKVFAPNPNNVIVLPGFQAGGTRGAALAGGARTIRIHGEDVPVNAEVVQLASMSAHADGTELLGWVKQMISPPRTTFITHGEPNASDTLRQRIERELHWSVRVPDYRETVMLTAR